MLKRIVEFIRRKNRARLERRRLAGAGGAGSGGWLTGALGTIRGRNRARLARRRAQRQLLASLAANDTALLEALVFLLKGARQEQQARADAEQALARRLAGLEERLDAGIRLLAARMTALEAGGASAPAADDAAPRAVTPPRAAPVNGDAQHASPQLMAGPGQAAAAEVTEPGEKRARRS